MHTPLKCTNITTIEQRMQPIDKIVSCMNKEDTAGGRRKMKTRPPRKKIKGPVCHTE